MTLNNNKTKKSEKAHLEFKNPEQELLLLSVSMKRIQNKTVNWTLLN